MNRKPLLTALAIGTIYPATASAFFPPVRTAAQPAVVSPGDPSIVGTPDIDPVKPPTVAATPEPATVLTGLIGLAAMAGYRLRRRKPEAIPALS